MTDQLKPFLEKLANTPESIDFAEVMEVIDTCYQFTETAFTNGSIANEAGQNNGSCKLFAFAQLQDLSEQQTLACFGQYYRNDVLDNPNGDDHQNIRNFMKTGWSGINYSGIALKEK